MAGELNVPRRAFLGVAGSVATRGLVPGECNASRPPEHQERAPVVLEPVRRIAIDPTVLGPEWRLEFDVVADRHSPSVVMSRSTPTKTIAEFAGGTAHCLHEMANGGIRQYAELEYCAVRASQRCESYLVKVWICETNSAAESMWVRSFATAHESGYVAADGPGEVAFKSVGGWSLPGKLFFRRYNVAMSVVGLGPNTDPRHLAERLDACVQSLAKMPGE